MENTALGVSQDKYTLRGPTLEKSCLCIFQNHLISLNHGDFKDLLNTLVVSKE